MGSEGFTCEGVRRWVRSFIGVYITLLVVQKGMRGIPDIKSTTSPTKRDTKGEQIINMSQIKVFHESDWIPDSGNGFQIDGKVNESQPPIGVSNE